LSSAHRQQEFSYAVSTGLRERNKLVSKGKVMRRADTVTSVLASTSASLTLKKLVLSLEVRSLQALALSL
jgi:hypothetical protein